LLKFRRKEYSWVNLEFQLGLLSGIKYPEKNRLYKNDLSKN
jgi:hypothetical protein